MEQRLGYVPVLCTEYFLYNVSGSYTELLRITVLLSLLDADRYIVQHSVRYVCNVQDEGYRQHQLYTVDAGGEEKRRKSQPKRLSIPATAPEKGDTVSAVQIM